jgi:hypothetical protein
VSATLHLVSPSSNNAEPRLIALADITNAGYNHREAPSEEDIDRIVPLFRNGPSGVAPIRVIGRRDNRFDVVGGHTRRAAAIKAGCTHILAIVIEPPESDAAAMLESFLDNNRQGRGVTKADRIAAVAFAREANPKISASEISAIVGLGVHTVESVLYPKDTDRSSARGTSRAAAAKRFAKAVNAFQEAMNAAPDDDDPLTGYGFWPACAHIATEWMGLELPDDLDFSE